MAPTVTAANPAFGPLAGGTIIELTGAGFLADAAAPDHVVIGGVESPLASVIDDSTLQFLLPTSVVAGDVEIDVFNQNGNGSATGIFHYSSAPTITSVAPGRVLFSSTSTTVTLTGSGYQDENAGPVTVLLDGTPAVDVMVQSDTQLTFTAPPGAPLASPAIAVSDARGTGTLASAFRYVPSNNPGLVVFPDDGRTFFTFFDSVAKTSLSVTLTSPDTNYNPAVNLHLRAVVFRADGTTIAFRSDGLLGTLDMAAQTLGSGVAIADKIPAATEVNGTLYAISRSRNALVTVDPATGIVTKVGPTGTGQFSCCGAALAMDGSGNMIYVGRVNNSNTLVSTLDMATGSAVAGGIALTSNDTLQEIRFLAGTLYGITNNALISIDPATGSSTSLQTFTQPTAMEVFQ